MQISSNLLHGSFSIKTVEHQKTTGKVFDGSWVENAKIEIEKVLELSVSFEPNCDRGLLNAALTISPRDAAVGHLLMLATHKGFGGDADQLKIKMRDYVDGLEQYPEWVIWMVCRNYVFNDECSFVPRVAQMRKACDLVHSALERHRERLINPPPAIAAKPKPAPEPPGRREKAKKDWTAAEWDEWVANADSMLAMAKQHPTMFDVKGWEKEAVDRRSERDRVASVTL